MPGHTGEPITPYADDCDDHTCPKCGRESTRDRKPKQKTFGKAITRKRIRDARATLLMILREYRKAEEHETGSILTDDREFKALGMAEGVLGDIDHSLDAEFGVKKGE